MNTKAIREEELDEALVVQPAPELRLWRELFVGFDWISLRTSPVFFGIGLPRGEGCPVVVVPGLFGSDAYLVELHRWLARVGYHSYYSEIGTNIECPRVAVERLIHTVEKVRRETGSRVRLIGHSLGGLLARGAALRRPDLIAQVITIGTPVNGLRVHPAVLAAARLINENCGDDCLSWLQAPLSGSVSEASIFSRTDGVVDWRTCVPAGTTPRVEVRGTHVGLVVNREVYLALAELLSSRGGSGRSSWNHCSRAGLRLIRGGLHEGPRDGKRPTTGVNKARRLFTRRTRSRS